MVNFVAILLRRPPVQTAFSKQPYDRVPTLLLCSARVGSRKAASADDIGRPRISMPAATSRPAAASELVELAARRHWRSTRCWPTPSQGARAGGGGGPPVATVARPRATRHSRPGLACDLRGSRAPALRLYRADDRARARFGEIEEHLGAHRRLANISPRSSAAFRSARASRAPGRFGSVGGEVAARINPMVEGLIATGNTAERRARLIELMRTNNNATVGGCGLDETLEFDPRGDAQIRRQ